MPLKLSSKWSVFTVIIVVNIAFAIFWFTSHRTSLKSDLIPVTPIDVRLRLINTLQNETVLESIIHLPDLNDTVWVAGNIDTNTALSQRSYRYQSEFIPSLNRVRKILSQLDDEKGKLASFKEEKKRLLSQLSQTTDGFETVLREKLQQITESDHGVVLSEPDKYWISVVNGPAATYLLSELKVQEALPMFSKLLSDVHDLPINKVFLFFAAHRLASFYPVSNLSPESKELYDQYMTLTADLPTVDKRDVLSWDSPFEIEDYRFAMLHRDVPELKSDKRQMTFYPAELYKLDTKDGEKNPKVDKYVASLSAFVRSVYGN